MPFKSPHPDLDIPKIDLLSYLFPKDKPASDLPIWLDSKNPSVCLSSKQALQYVKRLALGLDRLGVARGEVVMIYTPNHIFVPSAYLGIAGSGRVFSGANPAYTAAELTYQLKDTGAKALLVHPSLAKNAIAAAQSVGLPKDRIWLFSEQSSDPSDGICDWTDLLASNADSESWKWKTMTGTEAQRTVATINYSSGTTGLPKGVAVSHASIIANVEQGVYAVYSHDPTPPKERWLGLLPLYHAYGQLWTILKAVKLQCQVYVMQQFVYEDYLQAIQDYKITRLQVAPPIMIMLAKRPETSNYDLSSVKSILCGAAPLSQSLQNEICQRFNVHVMQGWGMTEVTCGGIIMPGNIHDTTGSVGQLLPNTECKLIDDAGNEVGLDQPGELCIRGPQNCLGYWKNDAATKDLFGTDGWLQSGDIAVVNKAGLFWIVDRKKELIKVNGLQVAPAELEAVLLENEDVADAACVGVTVHDEEWPRAYVTLTDSAKSRVSEVDIQKWIKARVSKHKQLVGGVRFVDVVPKLASGKIQRRIMREWAKRDAPALAARGSLRSKL